MATETNTTRRAFLSASGRAAIAVAATGALASCALPAIASEKSKMGGLIEAHRSALATFDREAAKLCALEASLPKIAGIPLSKDRRIIATTEGLIETIGAGDLAWTEAKIADLRAAKAAQQVTMEKADAQDEVTHAAAVAETAAQQALIAYRPSTLEEARQKAAYFQSCRCFTEWDGVPLADLFVSLAPAA